MHRKKQREQNGEKKGELAHRRRARLEVKISVQSLNTWKFDYEVAVFGRYETSISGVRRREYKPMFCYMSIIFALLGLAVHNTRCEKLMCNAINVIRRLDACHDRAL